MKVMSFSAMEILPALLKFFGYIDTDIYPKDQTTRPAWKMESTLKPHAIRHITGEENQFFKGKYISVDKQPRFKVGETIQIMWKQRSSPKGSWFFKNTGKIWNKEPSVYCCSSCLEDPFRYLWESKEIGHGDDIEACCCRFPKCQEEILFPKIFGTVKITEVFKIDMWKRFKNIFFIRKVPSMKSYRLYRKLVKRDGFKSAETMFRWFDKEYDLSVPKSFWVYRWEEDLR